MKSLLITGGAGFVGSALAIQFKAKYPSLEIYCFDNLKRRGSELNLPRLKKANINFIHGDIRIAEDFNELPAVDMIIEASAEPSVLAGINSTPDYLLQTNLVGTINCLNFAVKQKAGMIFLSTSRVYPIKTIEDIKLIEEKTRFEIDLNQTIIGVSQKGISEDFPLATSRSLYGTSKLSSELIIEEYNTFYNLKTVTNRCGVLTGPWQMGKVDQGVIVLWVARHFWKKGLSYNGYGGTGKQVRDILHTDDLFDLVDWQIANIDSINGQTFNVGGGREVSLSLCELTDLCEQATGNKINIVASPENRVADIPIYLTDNSKIEKISGWKPKKMPKDIIFELALWIKENEKDLEGILK